MCTWEISVFYSCCVEYSIYTYLLCAVGLQYHSRLLFPYWDFVQLSIIETAVLKFSTTVVDLPISPFNYVSVCFIYLEFLLFGVCTFTILTSWWIKFFFIIWCSFLSLVKVFELNSILSVISIATPTLFWLVLDGPSFSIF